MGAYGSPELYPNNSSKENKDIVYCQKCGFRYVKKNKKCPQCGQKHNMRFYNKWWFWVLVVFVILAIYPQSPKNNIDENTKAEQKILSENEYKELCVQVQYNDIARNPQNYKGEYATYTGKVIQVQENGERVILRVNITKDKQGLWNDTLYVEYIRKSNDEPRILNDDIITLYGKIEGVKSYTAVLGDQITLPYVIAEYITIN